MAGPKRGESKLKMRQQGIASVREGGVDELLDGSANVENVVVVVGFSPVVFAPVSKFNRESDIS